MRGIMTAQTKPTVIEPVDANVNTKAVKFENQHQISSKLIADNLDELINLLHNEKSNL
jgi:hypothetical protein